MVLRIDCCRQIGTAEPSCSGLWRVDAKSERKALRVPNGGIEPIILAEGTLKKIWYDTEHGRMDCKSQSSSKVVRTRLCKRAKRLYTVRPRGHAPRQKQKYKATLPANNVIFNKRRPAMSSSQATNEDLPTYTVTQEPPPEFSAGTTSASKYPEKGDFAIPNVSPRTAHVLSPQKCLTEVTPYLTSPTLRIV
jgi:hypothetical protein